jgi:hypothetical protein
MKIKRIRSLKVCTTTFKVEWPDQFGAGFDYGTKILEIGTKNNTPESLLMKISHELMEICAIEMNVRYDRPDCRNDYLFSYDHRQHDTMMEMFAGLLSEFLA